MNTEQHLSRHEQAMKILVEIESADNWLMAEKFKLTEPLSSKWWTFENKSDWMQRYEQQKKERIELLSKYRLLTKGIYNDADVEYVSACYAVGNAKTVSEQCWDKLRAESISSQTGE